MDIKLKWIGGATWILQIDKLKIACDPVLCREGSIQDYRYFKTKRLNNPIFDESDFENINIWLLTHNHEDHIDKLGFEKIDTKTTIIAHKSLKQLFSKDNFKNLNYLDLEESFIYSNNDISINIRALPAIHAKRKFFGRQIGNGNGYLLEIIKDDLKYTVYVTGDSVFNVDIKKYFDNLKIDLIITNAGNAMIGNSIMAKLIGRITNNIGDIKKMIAVLNPKIVIPVHWGTFTHYTELIDIDSFANYNQVKLINPGQTINLW